MSERRPSVTLPSLLWGEGIMLVGLLALSLLAFVGRAAAEYRGPIIDAHSHLPNLQVLDAYVQAMTRHKVEKVLLLGVGGVQKRDVEWIAAAAKKYPDKVLQAAPVPDPLNPAEAARLEGVLGTRPYKALGEAHIRQVSSKIDRKPDHPAFGEILEVAAKRGLPVVIHAELNDAVAEQVERALKAHPSATIVLAHAGSGDPKMVQRLLTRNPNLMVDLSGMHFLRSPALATENGPLDPAWKGVIGALPDRFLMGIDVWAPRLFEPVTLDRLMGWTRRILGELPPEAADLVAHKNARRLLKLGP